MRGIRPDAGCPPPDPREESRLRRRAAFRVLEDCRECVEEALALFRAAEAWERRSA